MDGIMPTKKILKAKGRSDLAHGIHKQGGISAVAERFGLKRLDTDRPRNYWRDFANVEKELRAYIAELGADGIMPAGTR
jgi:hypothetical protein